MLRILGSPRRLCDGIRRRDFLRAGSLAPGGLSLPLLCQSQAIASDLAGPGFGSAKSCILLYLYGSPTQLETFDVKPDGEADVTARGTASDINLFVWGRVPATAFDVKGDTSLLDRWAERVKI